MSPVHSAAAELVALAAAVRPDWDERDVSGVIVQATQNGMTWEQVLTGLPRLMADPAASPRDLIPVGPLAGRRCPDPSVAAEGAAVIRELLEVFARGAGS